MAHTEELRGDRSRTNFWNRLKRTVKRGATALSNLSQVAQAQQKPAAPPPTVAFTGESRVEQPHYDRPVVSLTGANNIPQKAPEPIAPEFRPNEPSLTEFEGDVPDFREDYYFYPNQHYHAGEDPLDYISLCDAGGWHETACEVALNIVTRGLPDWIEDAEEYITNYPDTHWFEDAYNAAKAVVDFAIQYRDQYDTEALYREPDNQGQDNTDDLWDWEFDNQSGDILYEHSLFGIDYKIYENIESGEIRIIRTNHPHFGDSIIASRYVESGEDVPLYVIDMNYPNLPTLADIYVILSVMQHKEPDFSSRDIIMMLHGAGTPDDEALEGYLINTQLIAQATNQEQLSPIVVGVDWNSGTNSIPTHDLPYLREQIRSGLENTHPGWGNWLITGEGAGWFAANNEFVPMTAPALASLFQGLDAHSNGRMYVVVHSLSSTLMIKTVEQFSGEYIDGLLIRRGAAWIGDVSEESIYDEQKVGLVLNTIEHDAYTDLPLFGDAVLSLSWFSTGREPIGRDGLDDNYPNIVNVPTQYTLDENLGHGMLVMSQKDIELLQRLMSDS